MSLAAKNFVYPFTSTAFEKWAYHMNWSNAQIAAALKIDEREVQRCLRNDIIAAEYFGQCVQFEIGKFGQAKSPLLKMATELVRTIDAFPGRGRPKGSKNKGA